MIENIDKVQWIEWRADLLGFEPPLQLAREKVLWTYRSANEVFPDQDCISHLIRALHSMALVDMQLIRDEALLRSLRHNLQRKVIVSFHGVYEGVQALQLRIQQMRFFPRARYWKIALDFSKASFGDLLACLAFLKKTPEFWQEKLLFVPMGLSSAAARLWAGCHFAGFLYTCLSQQSAVNSDQPNLDTALAFQRQTQEGLFYGLIGSSVKQSPSHLSHNAVFSHFGQSANRYLKFAVSENEAAELMGVAKELGIIGFSVTMPHKEFAFKQSSTASSFAQEAGAANLLIWKETGWHADNTDVKAFADLFGLHKIGQGSRVLVLGAGGAAKAALAPLVKQGAHINIVSRSLARATALKQSFLTSSELPHLIESYCFSEPSLWLEKPYDLIIHTTPLGMSSHDVYPFDFAKLSPKAILFEIVNGPAENDAETSGFNLTSLARYWAQQNRTLVHAGEFFIHQASYQFETWKGYDPSTSREVLSRFFNELSVGS